MRLRSLLSAAAWRFKLLELLKHAVSRFAPDYLSILTISPGHYYSPLISVKAARENPEGLPHDGPATWQHVDLKPVEQKVTLSTLRALDIIEFPYDRTPPFAYYRNNCFFPFMDAWALSAMLQWKRPGRIIEIGSGFSTAVVADTCREKNLELNLLCIEPYPNRLRECLKGTKMSCDILEKPVQEMDLDVFSQLQAGDILFIDSSHVAKPGSDVSSIFLSILPILAPGVLVHIHDIHFATSYPMNLYEQGVSWNESLFLRCFLLMNRDFEVVLFNSYVFDQFESELPPGIKAPGASFWMLRC